MDTLLRRILFFSGDKGQNTEKKTTSLEEIAGHVHALYSELKGYSKPKYLTS